MNKLLILSILFLLCSLMNMVNVVMNGNGFGFVMAGVWLAASAVTFVRYRQEKNGKDQEEQHD